MSKFRPMLNLLEERWNPSGTPVPPPSPYDPSAPPAQQQPILPAPTTGGPTPIIPPILPYGP